jgi:DNA gyrase subunit B
LHTLLGKALQYRKLLEKVDKKQWDKNILSALAFESSFSKETLKDKESVKAFFESFKQHASFFYSFVPPIEYALIEDVEHSCYAIRCLCKSNGIHRETVINFDLLTSTELEELRKMADALKSIGSPPFTVNNNDERLTYNTLSEVLEFVLETGEKGQEVQRYKGLGEMNPEQLWETTMNPEQRTLLQVQIEDAIEADEIFTILMGDQVEPRKAFIYKNAINVTNLDV